MKQLLMLLGILITNLTAFSQKDTVVIDSTKCFPYPVAKKIAVDLVKGDSAMAELNIANKLIDELSASIRLRDNLIEIGNQKEKNYLIMVDTHEKKYALLKSEYDKLNQKFFTLKKTNNYLLGGLAATLIYIVIRK